MNLYNNTGSLDLLKCSFCEKFLSVGPIFTQENESICGRCKFVERNNELQWGRQTVYESLAQNMIFPCSNISYGCNAQLKWGAVEEHENTCLYKKLHCPFFESELFNTLKCMWVGSGATLNAHLESCHGDAIKKLPEIIVSEHTTNSIYLTKIHKQLMIVTIKHEPPEKLHFMIMVNGTSTDCDSFRYQLELYDDKKMNTLILRRSRLEDAVGMEENLINFDKMLVINLSTIKELLKNPSVIMGRFGVIKKSKKDNAEGRSDNLLGENVLQELECPICKCYLVPPIYICTSGHSFCSKCKDQLSFCPTCRKSMQNGRNFTLENVVSCIKYPCVNREIGCSATCSTDKLNEHELECSFSGHSCFLQCTSGAIVNMFKHLKESHPDNLIIPSDLHILDVSDQSDIITYFSMCYGNDIFRVAFSFDEDFKFSLHQFSSNNTTYIYELELICSTESSEKFIISNECPQLSDDVFFKCTTVSQEMISKFISDEELIFCKIHLKRKI